MALLMFRTFGVIIVSFIVLIMYVLHRKKNGKFIKRKAVNEEEKIKYHPPETLLQTILNRWSNDTNFYPLFICEGSSTEKIKSISRSYYLNYIYRNILPKLPENIICYGWSLSENDEPIINQILKDSRKNHKLLISVRKGNKSDFQVETECINIKNRINNINNNTEIHFFDSSDEGCWLNYNY